VGVEERSYAGLVTCLLCSVRGPRDISIGTYSVRGTRDILGTLSMWIGGEFIDKSTPERVVRRIIRWGLVI
jgi:hypothetical protein